MFTTQLSRKKTEKPKPVEINTSIKEKLSLWLTKIWQTHKRDEEIKQLKVDAKPSKDLQLRSMMKFHIGG
jgi:hypothetical protein